MVSVAVIAALVLGAGALRAAESQETVTDEGTEDMRAFLGTETEVEVPEEAAVLVAVDTLLSQGATVDAVLGYLEILDDYPDSWMAALAEERLRGMANRAEATSEGSPAIPAGAGITAEDLAEVDSRLPAFDALKSARAKQMISYFCQVKGDCMAEVGMQDEASLAWRQCIGTVLATMHAHPNAALNIDGPRLALRIAKKIGPDEVDATIKALEALVSDRQPSVATWVAHYALADHYLHAGKDRQAGVGHLRAVYEGTKAGLIDAALTSAWAQQKGKTHFEWAAGWAEFELGHYDEAKARFERVLAAREQEFLTNPDAQRPEDRAISQKYADWAAFFIPVAVQRLNPGDDAAAVTAYETFLNDNPSNECADFARIELARLEVSVGALDKALALYKAVGDEHPEAKTSAENGIAEVTRLMSEATQ